MVAVGFPQKSSFGVITATEVRTPIVNNPAGELALQRMGTTKLSLTNTYAYFEQHVRLGADFELQDFGANPIIASDNAGSIDQLAPIIDALGVRTPLVDNPLGDLELQQRGARNLLLQATVTQSAKHLKLAENIEITDSGNNTIIATDNVGHIDQLARIDCDVTHLAIGSANATWIKCALIGWEPTADAEITAEGRVTSLRTGVGIFHVFYAVPLPTNRGGKALFINGTRVGISDADANDYVTSTYIDGFLAGVVTELDNDPTDKNTIDEHEDLTMDADCSAYTTIKVRVHVQAGNVANEFEIDYVAVRYYYA